jgi:hypothetical protein
MTTRSGHTTTRLGSVDDNRRGCGVALCNGNNDAAGTPLGR